MSKIRAKFDHSMDKGDIGSLYIIPYSEDCQGEKLQATLWEMRKSFRRVYIIIDDVTGYGNQTIAQQKAKEWLEQYREMFNDTGISFDNSGGLQMLFTSFTGGPLMAKMMAIQEAMGNDRRVRDGVSDIANQIKASDSFRAEAERYQWTDMTAQHFANVDAALCIGSMVAVPGEEDHGPVVYNGPRMDNFGAFKEGVRENGSQDFTLRQLVRAVITEAAEGYVAWQPDHAQSGAQGCTTKETIAAAKRRQIVKTHEVDRPEGGEGATIHYPFGRGPNGGRKPGA